MASAKISVRVENLTERMPEVPEGLLPLDRESNFDGASLVGFEVMPDFGNLVGSATQSLPMLWMPEPKGLPDKVSVPVSVPYVLSSRSRQGGSHLLFFRDGFREAGHFIGIGLNTFLRPSKSFSETWFDTAASAPTLREILVVALASSAHEQWRATRWSAEMSRHEPRIKTTKDQTWIAAHDGISTVDIANTDFENLPGDWQAENRASAETAVDQVIEAVAKGERFDAAFVEKASSVVHDAWLKRNGEWASDVQKQPYERLPEAEKEKDRVIVRDAVRFYQGH